MIEIKINRKKSNLGNIISNLTSAVSKGMDAALENTKKEAINLKHQMMNGEVALDENIVVEKKELDGRVYTNDPALVFVEYGTGVKKDPDLPHIGTTKTFIASGKEYWLVPIESVDKPIGELITIGENKYYLVFSQSAKPFMRTAAFNRRDGNIEDIKNHISKLIKEGEL